MAMRVRAVEVTSIPRKKARHGPRCDVVSVLSASSAIQDQIDRQLAGPLPPELHTDTCVRYWSALDQIKFHNAPCDVWNLMAETLNIAMLLAEHDIGLRYLQLFVDAQEALFRGYLRGQRTGVYRLDGPGIATITAALEIHDAQMDAACWGDVAEAERVMVERIDAGDLYTAEPVAA